jgi:hypothetical protein
LKPDRHAAAADADRIRTTWWSSVLLSAPGVQARGSRDALAELCKIYWYPTEIDEEIHALCEVFMASEWRLGP